MSKAGEARFDVEAVKTKIREQVRSRKDVGLGLLPFENARARSPVDMSFDSAAIESALGTARAHWNVGQELPDMSRRRGMSRGFFRFMGKVILRVGQLVTRDQRAFNQASLDALGATYAFARAQGGKLAAAVGDLVGETDANQQDLAYALAQLDARLGRLEARQEARSLGLEHQLEVLRAHLAAGREEIEENARAWDRTGTELETQLRGSREEITRRAREHLGALQEAGAGTALRPILDLGCGHGELLKVLRDEKLVARGLDSNRFAVSACREAGLDVAEGDLLETLDQLPEASLGAVTAIHVAEHLPLHVLLRALQGIVRALQPGGVAVLETPNPENTIVGSCNFYVDPTHQRPLHPETLRLLAESCGLVRVRVVRLHPFPPEFLFKEQTPVAQFLNERFFGPQDFAVIGYRAGER
ncbi:MAG: class I SAM-dependent methyltransferase [Archangium sp.]|nr:class I SAM-dependent methyltransferase [Archangium sp.]